MKKTKIICTMGPSTDKPGLLHHMIEAGMDLARFNFSHGDHAGQAMRINMVRQAAHELGKPVGLIADTKGPEMRLGNFANGKVILSRGASFCLTTQEVVGTEKIAFVNYAQLPQELEVGVEILLNDGKLTLQVDRIEGDKIFTTVIHGGELASRKRVAVPGVRLQLPFLSEQDISDLLFVAEHKMDYVAASFVRSADDVMAMRKVLEELGADVGVIAKIENHEGVSNLQDILRVSDGVMVARGDLGVEIPSEEVPLVQKMMIAACNKAGKPVITATQMLESMISNYRATRAEASDVANSIFDGTDAIMLSGETASGNYPLEAVQTMTKIALRTERALDYVEIFRTKGIGAQVNTTDAISHATVQIAQELEADAIMTVTESGYTARMIAKYRPQAPVIAVTPLEASLAKMQLYWGVQPLLGPSSDNTDQLIDVSLTTALKAALIHEGDSVVVTAGMHVGKVGSTNLIKVMTIGTKIASGLGIGKKVVVGKVCKVHGPEDVDKFTPGAILVVLGIVNETAPCGAKAAGIIAEEDGFTSAAAIVGINCGVPVIVGVSGAWELLEDGEEVTMDVTNGSVYRGRINIK